MLNFNHLQYFWAVAHEGNLTRAARQLHVSPSAVSVQIQKLEHALGQPLFERRGRQLALTEAGRIALDHADSIFSVGRELESTLRESRRERQVLRVGAQATLSRNFQLSFIEPLLAREDVEFVLRSAPLPDLLRSLEVHSIDVALATTAPPHDAGTPWVAHALGTQAVSLVGRRRRGRSKRLETLLATEALVLPGASSSIRAGFDALVDRLGVRPRISAEVDDMAMLRLLARAGQGLAVVPSIVVRDELEAGTLVECAQLPDLQEAFVAITLRRRFPNPLLRALLPRGAPAS